MFIVLDAGSTKTDVRLVDGKDGSVSLELAGINPFFMEREAIREELSSLCGRVDSSEVSAVYYYGAGCVSEYEGLFEELFASLFPKARVEAHSDLYAACRATLGDSEGIACIMGTGSNSCHYDGSEIVENVSPLGFILGDEGSGAVLGKLLVGDVLKGCAPDDIREKFFSWCGVDRKTIMDGVYKKSFPNRYLATFTRFLFENLSHDYCKDLVEKSFVSFFERNVSQYPSSVRRIGFVGSVAYYFSDILKGVCSRYGFTANVIVQRPMDALVAYHKERL